MYTNLLSLKLHIIGASHYSNYFIYKNTNDPILSANWLLSLKALILFIIFYIIYFQLNE